MRRVIVVDRPRTGESRAARLSRIALLGAVALLLVGLLWKGVDSAQTSAALFSYPFQFDESEGMIVAETMLLERGVNIYERPTPELFVAAPYPPVFYLLNWPLQHLAGPEPTFKTGRALSVLATLLAGLCIFGIVGAVGRDRLAGAVAAAAWWSLGLVAFWGSLVKPDMLAVAFGLVGLWWLVSRPPGQTWYALPFFLAAFYTKQTAIAPAVAAIAWLLLMRPRMGLAFGAAYASGAIVPSLALNWLTGGGYYYHMYTVHDLPWFGDRFQDFLRGFVSAYGAFAVPGAVALAVGAVMWLANRVRGRSEAQRQEGSVLLLFYLAMSLVVAVGTGTLGGNHNHLLDLAAACSMGLGMGVALARGTALPWQARPVLAVVALLMLAQVPALFRTPTWLGLELRVPPEPVTEGMTNVFQYVTNNGGPAYSDNVGLMLITRKKLWSTDPFTQTHATRYGRWDESKLVAAIRDKRFSQIILRIDVFKEDAGSGDVSPGVLRAVRDSYKLDQRNVENIYVPR